MVITTDVNNKYMNSFLDFCQIFIKLLVSSYDIFSYVSISCFQFWWERKIKNAVNNTIVLLKAKVAAELHSHLPFDLLHDPV